MPAAFPCLFHLQFVPQPGLSCCTECSDIVLSEIAREYSFIMAVKREHGTYAVLESTHCVAISGYEILHHNGENEGIFGQQDVTRKRAYSTDRAGLGYYFSCHKIAAHPLFQCTIFSCNWEAVQEDIPGRARERATIRDFTRLVQVVVQHFYNRVR